MVNTAFTSLVWLEPYVNGAEESRAVECPLCWVPMNVGRTHALRLMLQDDKPPAPTSATWPQSR